MLRGIRRLAVVGSALLAVGMVSMPASASGAAAGAVTGNVTLSPGFTTVPPAAVADQTFGFSSVVLTGVGASTACAGVLSANASASGASIAENLAGGVGNLSINANATCTVGSATIICTGGVYVRAGIIVIVIDPTCVVTGQVAASAVVVPASVFIPNQTPPSNVTSATFAGAWALVSA